MRSHDLTRRPTVLVLTKSLAVGGAEKLIAEGSRYWDRDRFDYRVAYLLPGAEILPARLAAQGVPVHFLGSPRGVRPSSHWRLRRLVADHPAELVHAHLPVAGILARLAVRAPVVYTEHSDVALYRLPTRAANRLTYGRNRAVIAVSEAVARSVASYPGPLPVVIPNGVVAEVDPASAADRRAEVGADDGRPLVVHVGNVRPEKGHRNLLAAAELLHRRHPDVLIVSLGRAPDPRALAALRDDAAAAGLAGTIRFMGFRADALEFVGAADVVVSPSDTEGLPLAVLEAMMLGRPIVATAVGGVPSVLTHGRTGLLVPPRSPESLASAVSELLAAPDLAARLGAAAGRLAARKHGLEPMVRATEALYAQVLGGSTVTGAG